MLNRTKSHLFILIFMEVDAGKLFKIKNKSFNKETSYEVDQKVVLLSRELCVCVCRAASEFCHTLKFLIQTHWVVCLCLTNPFFITVRTNNEGPIPG